MSANLAAQQNLAERLATVLRRFEHEGGSIDALADKVGETARDLRRWAEGTKLPGHVFCMLLGELPLHLANILIRPTGLSLEPRPADDAGSALLAAAESCDFGGLVARCQADGRIDHRERAEIAKKAQVLIARLQPLASE
ncbi:MAG: hypothetical protein ACRDBL_04600 [Rhabdaerophilum sp.]